MSMTPVVSHSIVSSIPWYEVMKRELTSVVFFQKFCKSSPILKTTSKTPKLKDIYKILDQYSNLLRS